MNSFLFNILIILLTSVSVIQFCSDSFREYGSMTDIELIFSIQIKHLEFFSWFYDNRVFEYILFGVIILTTFFLLICTNTKKNSLEYLYKKQVEDEGQRLTGPMINLGKEMDISNKTN